MTIQKKARKGPFSHVADGDKSVYAGMLRPEIAAKVYPGIARVQINPPQKGVRPQTTPARIEKLEPEPVARSVKKCCRCKSELPLDEFFRDRSRRDGLTARCKECCYDHYNEQRRKRVQAS